MDNKQLARRFFEEGWNKGDLKVIDEVMAPEATNNDPYSNMFGTGPNGTKNMIKSYRAAFPDVRINVEHQIVEGDYVVTRWSSSGTLTGELMGNQPTNKKAKIFGISIAKFRNGKVVETWDNWDTLGMFQQLGIEPKVIKMPTGRTQPGM